MKILVVTHDSNFSGGANRSLYMVLTKLKKEYNVDIDVLLPSKKGELNKKLDEAGIHWFSYKYFGVVSGIRKDGKDFLRIFKVYIGYIIEHFLAIYLSHKLKKDNYDLVYTNTRLPIVGAKIAKRLSVPHICHVREFGTVKPLWGWWKHKDIYRMSSRVICISQSLANTFTEKVPNDKIVTIYNGIDSPLNLPKSYNSKSKELNIIIVGRLVPDKGQDEAIRAISILKDRNIKNIKLHIVGSSPKRTHISWYEENLKKMVDDLNLNEFVEFHGEIKNMTNIRKNMDIELMCAICETFGRVTVEAMRSGLLVIGTNTGATPEIINDGRTGMLYEQGNAESLADKIEKVYKNKKECQKIVDQGYDFSQVNYTPDKNVKEIYDVMIEVLDEKGK